MPARPQVGRDNLLANVGARAVSADPLRPASRRRRSASCGHQETPRRSNRLGPRRARSLRACRAQGAGANGCDATSNVSAARSAADRPFRGSNGAARSPPRRAMSSGAPPPNAQLPQDRTTPRKTRSSSQIGGRDAVGNARHSAEPFHRSRAAIPAQNPSAFADRSASRAHTNVASNARNPSGTISPVRISAGMLLTGPGETHAMKIPRQQRHHSPLNHRREQHDFPQAQPGANRHCQQRAGARRQSPRQSRCQPLRRGARISMRNCATFGGCSGVARDVAQMSQPGAVRRAGALHPRQRQAGDHARRDERELEARIRERRRLPKQNRQRRERHRVQQLDAAKKRPRAQVECRHQRSAKNRRTVLHYARHKRRARRASRGSSRRSRTAACGRTKTEIRRARPRAGPRPPARGTRPSFETR